MYLYKGFFCRKKINKTSPPLKARCVACFLPHFLFPLSPLFADRANRCRRTFLLLGIPNFTPPSIDRVDVRDYHDFAMSPLSLFFTMMTLRSPLETRRFRPPFARFARVFFFPAAVLADDLFPFSSPAFRETGTFLLSPVDPRANGVVLSLPRRGGPSFSAWT